MVIIDRIKNKFKEIDAKRRARMYLSRLRKHQKINISEAYLFGSYAKRKSQRWSDIDVCVVSPDFRGTDALLYLWRNRTKEDSQNRIEPVGFDDGEFNENMPSPFIREIKKTGIRLI